VILFCLIAVFRYRRTHFTPATDRHLFDVRAGSAA
jgi:hypothetical protein